MHTKTTILAVALMGAPTALSKKTPSSSLPIVSQTTCGGIQYINRGLVAYGTVPSDARDKLGDTLGGFGSSITPDVRSFKKNRDGTISGRLFAAPDRGWNTEGTTDFQGRIHEFQLSFKPTFGNIAEGTENLKLTYKDSTLLWKGKTPTTGLDADSVIPAQGSFPDLPAAKRPSGEVAPTLDLEGLVRLRDGSFWISDEYGPYIYHFSKNGQLVGAIEPPASFIPYRSGQKSFLSGNPPVGSKTKAADDPDTGRANNHGFEGLAISPVRLSQQNSYKPGLGVCFSVFFYLRYPANTRMRSPFC